MKQFLNSRGFHDSDMVVLTDDYWVDPNSPSYPSGQNILRAFDWLVARSEGFSLFLHYSGHGGQVQDTVHGGIDDTICPVDFQQNGQIDADILHDHLVSRMPPSAQLHAVFDCCHSGTAMQLPFTYRTDEDGNVSLLDK
jgi:metacaspase-1